MANPINPPTVYPMGVNKGTARTYSGLILRPKLPPKEGQLWPRGNPQT